MGNGWTHEMCETCWRERHETSPILRPTDGPPEPCCFCRRPTRSGIYVRYDPLHLACRHSPPRPIPEDDAPDVLTALHQKLDDAPQEPQEPHGA